MCRLHIEDKSGVAHSQFCFKMLIDVQLPCDGIVGRNMVVVQTHVINKLKAEYVNNNEVTKAKCSISYAAQTFLRQS